MPRLFVLILTLVALLLVSGGIYVAVWNVPAPVRTVEKDLPNDMLAQ
ncbi:MAG: hypothetical protein ACOY17_07080 [Pseudomonadota bacterium]|jgi:hypothetical protein